ncbi:hypothetical protein GKC56_03885 [Neisseriaceae bacterium PsAf]|nr:hypothetical protein [Neisseriaceae bacterium PsAf]
MGRSNRLIKLQEKRISLDEIENQILNLAEVVNVFVFIGENDNKREIVNAVCELSNDAWQTLKKLEKFNLLVS